jgi:NitT/TauT family transport system permease protein
MSRALAFAPVATVLALVLLWAVLVRTLGLPSHLLPAPDAVALRLWDGLFVRADMAGHLWRTVWSAALGFALGGAAAVLVVLLDASPVAERIFYPLLAGIQSIPKVALAPLVLIWAGFGVQSIVLLVALICFYPIFVSAFSGLRAVNADMIALCRVSGGSGMFQLVHAKLPSALGPTLTGCEVAVAFALVGCVVMEFITGTGGAGFLIDNSSNQLDTTTAVATMVALGIIGAAGATAVRAARRRIVFWEAEARDADLVARRAAG